MVQSLGWEDPLEKGMDTHSSILVWRIPWREEPGKQPNNSNKDYTMWLFDIHFEMATIVKLIISIASHNYLCVCMCVCV